MNKKANTNYLSYKKCSKYLKYRKKKVENKYAMQTLDKNLRVASFTSVKIYFNK